MDSRKPRGYWTKERVLSMAATFENKNEWISNSSSSYTAALKHGWVEDASQHMTKGKQPNGYWSKDRVLEDALKYTSRTEWKKSSPAYGVALTNDWQDEATQHMTTSHQNGYWTKERIIEDAKRFSSKKDWRIKSNNTYRIALENGWKDEASEHMENYRKFSQSDIIEDALQYSTLVEWKTSSPSMYNTSIRRATILRRPRI